MIDKRIFYCWFGGGEMSEMNKKCIESWKKHCPDYEIIEINESNYDYIDKPYAKEAYEHGNWSYVSNAARLKFLKENSGFYLDTDIQLVKSLDSLREYDGGFITEFDSGQPDSGILGRGSIFPELYQKAYDGLVPGAVLHKEFIKNIYQMYDVHGEQIVTYDDGFTILGDEYFPSVRTGLFTANTIGVHYFENTWSKQWRDITDPFYPFPRVFAKLGNKIVHQDKNPEVILIIKNLFREWDDPTILYRTDYLLNPKVVKLSCKDFDAEKINYDKEAPQKITVATDGMVVTYLA